jgi:hypothetical protein
MRRNFAVPLALVNVAHSRRSDGAPDGFIGAVAQLGERLNGIQEVVGSIPISSTNEFKDLSATARSRFFV